MEKSRTHLLTKTMTCLLLAVTAMLAALLFAYTQNAYAADNEAADLQWSASRSAMAEWIWPGGLSDDDYVTVTAMYSKTADGEATKSYTVKKTKYDLTNKTTGKGRYLFGDNAEDDPFHYPEEGYYWFSVTIDGNTVEMDTREKFIVAGYNWAKVDEDGDPVSDSTNWDLHYAFGSGDYYYVRNKVVARPGTKVWLKLDNLDAGFSFGGYSFAKPEPEDCSDLSEPEISFTLNESTYVKFTIVKNSVRVRVNIDYGTGHEGSAEKTAAAIESEGKYNASVDGQVLTIEDWPKSSREVLKNYVAEKTYYACYEAGESCVYENYERYTGTRYILEGYDGSRIGIKPIDQYSSVDEYIDEMDDDAIVEIPDEGQTFYLQWDKPVSEVAYTIEAPVCGTEVTVESGGQTNHPVVTAEDGCLLGVSDDYTPYWKGSDGLYRGTIVGDQTYTAIFGVSDTFGYYATYGITVKVNGTAVTDDDSYRAVRANITAVHAEDEPVIENEVAATCTEAGSYDEVVYCKGYDNENCTKVYSRETKVIPALGHAWGEPSYEWADDHSTVTATRVCKNDAAHVETETITASSKQTKDPTCEEAGEITYTAEFTNSAFAAQTYKESIEALGHAWGEWTITKEATEDEEGEEQRTCSRCSQVDSRVIPRKDHEHVLTEVEEVAASCLTSGMAEHYKCEGCGALFVEAEDGEEAEVDGKAVKVVQTSEGALKIPATGHKAGDPQQTSYTKETCSSVGIKHYRTYCEKCGTLLWEQQEIIDKDPDAHVWGEPTYEWSDDYSTCTASCTCTKDHDPAVTLEETVDTTSEITRQPTETRKGETTYTAKFTNEEFETQTKSADDIPMIVSSVDITLEAPVCGTKVSLSAGDGGSPDSVPEISVTTNPEFSQRNRAYWIKDDMDLFEGTFQGGKNYTAYITLAIRANDQKDYQYSKDITVRVNGKEVEPYMNIGNGLTIKADITAVHDWDDGTVTKEATCEEAGAKTVSCRHNSEDWHTEDAVDVEIEIPAFGHDWGQWREISSTQHQRVCSNDSSHVETADHTWDEGQVTKEPTVDEEGVRTYTCTADGCGATRTESIAKLKPTPTPTPTPSDSGDDETATTKSTVKPVLVAKGIASGKKAVKISWNKVSGADRYVIYMARCNYKGKKYSFKKIKTVSAGTLKYKKTKLAKKTAYRFYVVAQKKVNGKYTNLAKSKAGHVFTGNVRGKYTNPKKLKLNKTKVTLSVGKSTTIKGTVTKVKRGKKLATTHAKKLRFKSNNPAVATVSASGKVTAKSKGTAKIYVQTINGIWKTVKVTVK